jgi:hypothetical protein
MSADPHDPSKCLVTESWRSLFDTSIRVRDGVEPAAVLAQVVQGLFRVSTLLGSEVTLTIEPNGDSCETGHWVEIAVTSDTAVADMTPWPSRFDGVVPTDVVAQLELAGWQMVVHHAEAAVDATVLGPCPRLFAVDGVDDLYEWAELVADAVYRVIDPAARRWYLYAQSKVVDSGPFGDPPYSPTPYDGEWAIDISRIAEPQSWVPAVWASDSEMGYVACQLGLHEYHEPPCPPQVAAEFN